VVRLDRETGETYVHRRRGEEIERVDVTLGARYEGVVQVVDGLSAGDEIVRLGDSSSLSFGPR
jgi:multidrug efflux pump subunit AcrA (membrane-fusion protein)